jgi:hypothetical protein
MSTQIGAVVGAICGQSSPLATPLESDNAAAA